MEITHPICCGIDVHEKVVVACLRRVEVDGKVALETRSYATTYRSLRDLLDWLTANRCSIVAMESTGVYWKPVYHVLDGATDIVVGNACDMKRRPGRKTDVTDAEWIAELLAHDLITPSFVPPPPIQALRDLTRTRVKKVQARTNAKNHAGKVLQDTNIKLGSVASDMFGKSGRAMLDALVAGERDSKVLAELALGRLRKKIPELVLALEGSFTSHHARLIQMDLAEIDLLNRHIEELDARIGELVEPMLARIEQLKSIPGVMETAARTILAEIGTDMKRFGSSGRLCSWAGVCPGNNESAGKRYSGRTRKGNRWLRRILVQCTWATRKTETFLGRSFRRLQARLGGKKAAMAVAHKILTIVYILLSNGEAYDDGVYDRPDPRMEARRRRQALRTLESLGFEVSLTLAGVPS